MPVMRRSSSPKRTKSGSTTGKKATGQTARLKGMLAAEKKKKASQTAKLKAMLAANKMKKKAGEKPKRTRRTRTR